MNKSFCYNLILMLGCVFINSNALSQTYYYKLTKKIENGNQHTNTAGGQFITFEGETCFDSDKYGINIGNGILTFNNCKNNTFKDYSGSSYFGKVTYRFKSDLSVLNIVVNVNLIYVYKRTPPPVNQTTSSLRRKKHSNNSFSTQQVFNSSNDIGYDNSFNKVKINSDINNDTKTSRQKTNVRKQCAYCSGKGELIQHEHISTFGLNGPRVYCDKCNQSWNYGTVHAHHKCAHCKGTGYYEYEY